MTREYGGKVFVKGVFFCFSRDTDHEQSRHAHSHTHTHCSAGQLQSYSVFVWERWMARVKIGCRFPDTHSQRQNLCTTLNISAIKQLDESILCIYIENTTNSQFLVLTRCYQHSRSDERQHSKSSQLCRDDFGR